MTGRKFIWFMEAVEAANEAFEENGYTYKSPLRCHVIGAIHKRAGEKGIDMDDQAAKIANLECEPVSIKCQMHVSDTLNSEKAEKISEQDVRLANLMIDNSGLESQLEIARKTSDYHKRQADIFELAWEKHDEKENDKNPASHYFNQARDGIEKEKL